MKVYISKLGRDTEKFFLMSNERTKHSVHNSGFMLWLQLCKNYVEYMDESWMKQANISLAVLAKWSISGFITDSILEEYTF